MHLELLRLIKMNNDKHKTKEAMFFAVQKKCSPEHVKNKNVREKIKQYTNKTKDQ